MPLAELKTEVAAALDAGEALGDIVFVSIENWDEVWRRNQFFTAEFARRNPARKILFVGLDTDVTNNIRRGHLTALLDALSRGGRLRPAPDFPNVFLLNAVKWLPNTVTVGRKFNEWIFRRQVRIACRELGVERPLLWLNPHYAAHMVGKMGERRVVYDITDDWALATFSDRERRLIEAQDRALCQSADLTIVCSEALADSRRERARRLLLIPNGVNVENYAQVAAATSVTRGAWNAPTLGYTGTLHSDRIDYKLIVALARAFPQGVIALVGPDELSPEVRQALLAEKNIVITGAVPYTKIADVMLQFDVCIVPHQESHFVESLNPIKLWEYLASGKPIVSANVAGFRSYPDLCRIASGPENFIAACRDALSESADKSANKKAERVAEAKKNTWTSRVDRLIAEIALLEEAPRE